MKRLVLFLCAVVLMGTGNRAFGDDDWLTYYEKSDYLETPRYEQTVEFCQRLDEASEMVTYTSFGVSPQGRELPLLIIDKSKKFEPIDLEIRKKPVVLIQACIHAGEPDGKDAGLTLIRDIVIHGKHKKLLDNTTILFIPIFSVDGHERFSQYNRINQNGPKEMGWRVTAQGLNLNRDFLKADSPEMRDWLGLFTKWLPDFLIDCHVTDGADFQYAISYVIANRQNMVRPVRQWINRAYLPELTWKMNNSGFPLIPYFGFKDHFDISKGAMTWLAPPRFSHGYGAAQNRPFLLVETHMLKDYKTRVEATYQILLHTLEIVNSNAEAFLYVVKQGDKFTAEEMVGKDYDLRYRVTNDSVMLDFKGVDYEVVDSDISGGKWIQWGDEPVDYRFPWFNVAEPTATTTIPYAYIVPPEWNEEVELMKLHGVSVKRLTEEMELDVESYKLINASWQEKPYEGRHPVKFETETISEKRTYPKGSAVLVCDQRTNRVIAEFLEPRAYDSFVSWGFFDVIFEQKEYAEDYAMEVIAREMLSGDATLKAEFEAKVATDSVFAASPSKRLDFFYQRSPYWDNGIGVYPVGKITAPLELPLE